MKFEPVISAFVEGCRVTLRDGLGLAEQDIGARPGPDGEPLAAYQGGGGDGWFYGVYFGGAQLLPMGSVEEWALTLTIGLDVTRVWTRSPTRKTAWYLENGDLLERAGRAAALLFQDQSTLARACEAQYALRMGESVGGRRSFLEGFDAQSISAVRQEGPGWIARVPDSKAGAPPVVFVVKVVTSGLKFRKTLVELAADDD